MTPNMNSLFITPHSTHQIHCLAHLYSSHPLTTGESEVWRREMTQATQTLDREATVEPRPPSSRARVHIISKPPNQGSCSKPRKASGSLHSKSLSVFVNSLPWESDRNYDANPVMCSPFSILYSIFPPVTSCDNQNSTEGAARQNCYSHFTDGEREPQGNLASKGRSHDSNPGHPG